MTTIAQQTTFRHKLAYLLGMSYLEYENYRHEYFLHYCKRLAQAKYIPLELLTKNDHLKNWFDSEWVAKVEREIQQKYEPLEVFDEKEIDYLIELFYDYNVADYYPNVLVKEICKEFRTKKIITQ